MSSECPKRKFIILILALAFTFFSARIGFATFVTDETIYPSLDQPTFSPNPVSVNTTTNAALHAGVEQPSPNDPEATVGSPNWSFIKDTVEVSDTENGTYTPAGPSTYDISFSGGGTSSDGNVAFTPKNRGYWKVTLHAHVEFHDSDGVGYTGDTDAKVTTVRAVARVVSITEVSGATQTNVTGAKNWAAVKDTGDVIVEVTLDPNTDAAASDVTWTGGAAVTGHPRQRSVSKTTSAHTNVKATSGNTSADLDVWILWVSVEIKITGTTPANAVQFGLSLDGTELLGARLYDGGNTAVGKMVAIGTISPPGVHDVVKDGWVNKRERIWRKFIDGVKSTPWDLTWTDDTSGPSWQKKVPDNDDKIYDDDGPNIAGSTDSSESYINFRQYVEWTGTRSSDYAPWYWKAWWKADQTPQVTMKEVGTGAIDPLPEANDAHYPPPH